MDLPECDENYFYNSKPKAKVAVEHPQVAPQSVSSTSSVVEWTESPFENPQLCKKIRKAAHKQIMEVLTLIKKNINLSSTFYKDIYFDIFKTIIAK